ncbi:hypothetical protein [Ruminococcus sp. CAG:330]|uniref:hypothetical protein n=1 Tax=Ruminococcus sp. CAG:330 TaxID=1262954 RepID=UPI00033B03B9|nr:hypothetical protein [Ruminococcus sp. CAG:330]CDE12127.1 unknown [Ruminococcus sp. CAG:330]
MKIEVGKMYLVGGEGKETGNIIKITGKYKSFRIMQYFYETVSGKNPNSVEFFEAGSDFSKHLVPVPQYKNSEILSRELKVVILRNGNTVTATQYMDGEKRGTGVAKCAPGDAFDFAFGAKLALERLFTESNGVAKTRFDWFTFGDGKISVQVNRETINDFLQNCEKKGFFWRSGKQATKFNPFVIYDDSCEDVQKLIRLSKCEPKENVWISTREGKLCFVTDVPESEIFVWTKPFDWESFKSGKIAVKLTKKNEKSFLEAAEKNGCKWRAGQKPTEWVLDEEIFYLCCKDCGYGKFVWSDYNCHDLKVVEW